MKEILIIALLISSIQGTAQDCDSRLQNAPGKWGQVSRSEKGTASAVSIQSKFLEAVSEDLEKTFTPQNVQVDRSLWHDRPDAQRPVSAYGLTLYAMDYNCKDGQLKLNHETSTTMRIDFNQFTYAELYETSSDYILTGFHKLTLGLPVEVKPGIWQFPDQRMGLGFGIEGIGKLWLITFDGKLPWAYVSRKEFLLKRKQNLQKQLAEEEPRLKEKLAQWEMLKKMQEENTKNDPAKMTVFMNGTYNPGVERDKKNYKDAVDGWTIAIQRVESQLLASPTDLSKPAIVVRSQTNFRDYDFTENAETFSEVLVKPNPAYFNKALNSSLPQFITVEIKGNPKNAVATRFMSDIQASLNLDYLKSFIGKSTPGTKPANSGVQKANAQSSTSASGLSVNMASNVTDQGRQNTSAESSTHSNNGQSEKPLNVTTGSTSSGKSYKLAGTLSAPVGVRVTVGYNGGNDITITPQKTDALLYQNVPLAFTKSLPDKARYKVEIKNLPANTRGVVYSGSGETPSGVDDIRIAVDYSFDLVTRSSDDKMKSSFYESWAPAVGGYQGEEGRYVAFVSNTKNFEGSDGKFRQIYWRDRNTGITKIISRSPLGELANGDCNEPSISADGKSVVFESKATNLVSGDNNNVRDIFIWKASSGTVEVVSAATNGSGADGESFDAMISGNGQYVVFTSLANNISSTPKGRSVANIFLRDVRNAKTEMISVDPVARTGGNGYKGSISFEGNHVSFCSASNTLVPDDKNGLWDIFIWQRGKPALKRVSLTHDGKERDAGVESASRQVASAISGNGKVVTFATTATNMVPGDNNKFQDVFAVEIETGRVSVVSFTENGEPSNGDSPIEQGERVAISYDGTWIAFPTKATNLGTPSSNIVLHNLVTGRKQLVSDNKGTYVGKPSISYSGSYLVFGKASNLDTRFPEAGIFAHFTGNGPCRNCKD